MKNKTKSLDNYRVSNIKKKEIIKVPKILKYKK